MTALKLIANEPTYEPATAPLERILLFRLSELDKAKKEVATIEAEIETLGRQLIQARNPDHREFVRPTIARIRREVGR